MYIPKDTCPFGNETPKLEGSIPKEITKEGNSHVLVYLGYFPIFFEISPKFKGISQILGNLRYFWNVHTYGEG